MRTEEKSIDKCSPSAIPMGFVTPPDVREKALHLAIASCENGVSMSDAEIVARAKVFETYLKGE